MARKSKMARIEKVVGRQRIRLYIRVSTDRQAEEGYSLGIQEEKLRAYISTLMDNDVEFDVVSDDGYSGGDLHRPGIQRIIEEAESGKITHVVVMKLDRLSRSLKDTMHLIEDIFLPNNVAFISLYESFDTSTPFGRAMIGILSVFAQFERENIFERTRSGMQKRVEAGFWPGGGGIPFGYDYDPAQGILVPNSDADKVRYIYDKYLAGGSLQTIADQLGLKYEKVAYNILTRKSNAGYIIYNGEEYKGKHEPIISLETYEQAMEMLAIRSAKKLVSKSTHLLTGLCICGKCGAKMRYAPWGKGQHKLVCYSQQTSKAYLIKDPNCDQDKLWAEDVEKAILNALFTATAQDKLDEVRKSTSGGAMEDAVTAQLEKATAKLRRLYSLYGESGDDVLLMTINETKSEIARLESQLHDEQEKKRYSNAASAVYSRLENLQDLWPLMTIQERRTILASVVETITISNNSIEIKLKYGLTS